MVQVWHSIMHETAQLRCDLSRGPRLWSCSQLKDQNVPSQFLRRPERFSSQPLVKQPSVSGTRPAVPPRTRTVKGLADRATISQHCDEKILSNCSQLLIAVDGMRGLLSRSICIAAYPGYLFPWLWANESVICLGRGSTLLQGCGRYDKAAQLVRRDLVTGATSHSQGIFNMIGVTNNAPQYPKSS